MRRFNVCFVLTLLVVTIPLTPSTQAQTFQVIYTFTGGADGLQPLAGLTMDGEGNLYGTTYQGAYGFGTVFKLSNRGSGWVLNPIHRFTGGNDGSHPSARVIFGPDGTLYGTTADQGGSDCGGYGCGTVFNLKPPLTGCTTALCPWTETVLYRFQGGTDGGNPLAEVAFDQSGNLYGTTNLWGQGGNGTVYELSPSDGIWNERVLYAFSSFPDGANPTAGVILDQAGNLFGTTQQEGAHFFGTVFQLASSGSDWTEQTIYNFGDGSEGAFPSIGLTSDASGNLYGATYSGGSGGGGTVFKLTPFIGGWAFNLIYSFNDRQESGPYIGATLVMDSGGNLYGTTYQGGNGCGTIFKLTPSDGTWTQTVLHAFTCTPPDGGWPQSGVVFDKDGNMYGTASGGDFGTGVVWEITPQGEPVSGWSATLP